jgi:glycogen synthase
MMLSWEYPPRIVGGISPHVHDLSQQLQAKGVDVHVVTKSTPLAPDEEVQASGVHVHRVHLTEDPNDFVHEIQLLNLATEKKVRQLLEDWRPGGEPTLFHAHDWLSLDSARELKYEYSLPLVATVHATESGRHGGIHNETSRYIHEQEYWLTYEAWRTIVASEFMKSEVNRIFNVPEDKVDVIYNGVNAAKFDFEWTDEERAAYRAKFAEPDEKIILYVGRFVREKGIHLLLDCANVVLAEDPKAKFIIVGSGGAVDRFKRFSDWAGIGDRVLFTGFMSQRPLYQLYRCADVTVFPSLYEPFGIVALEGMAAGAPVVASDAGGLKEVVLHDKTGTSFYSSNPESLAWAIIRVLKDPVRARKLAESARARLQTDFNWSNIADRTIDVYNRTWEEFLHSYWIDKTLWPVVPGAEERAEEKHVREKATAPMPVERPRPAVTGLHRPEELSEEEEKAKVIQGG